MAFNLVKPSARRRLVPVVLPASTPYLVGDLVAKDMLTTGSSVLKASPTNRYLEGRIMKAVAASDPDYASPKTVMVERDEDGVWEADVGTGTAALANMGYLADLTDEDSVDVTATSVKQFAIDKVKKTGGAGTGKLLGKLLIWA